MQNNKIFLLRTPDYCDRYCLWNTKLYELNKNKNSLTERQISITSFCQMEITHIFFHFYFVYVFFFFCCFYFQYFIFIFKQYKIYSNISISPKYTLASNIHQPQICICSKSRRYFLFHLFSINEFLFELFVQKPVFIEHMKLLKNSSEMRKKFLNKKKTKFVEKKNDFVGKNPISSIKKLMKCKRTKKYQLDRNERNII